MPTVSLTQYTTGLLRTALIQYTQQSLKAFCPEVCRFRGQLVVMTMFLYFIINVAKP